MSEEKLYIDDGELVYYINENEFIACDEIPMPMLEAIEDLQQKVEQLENIRKEAIEYIGTDITARALEQLYTNYELGESLLFVKIAEDLLNILNKGSDKE